MIPYYFVLDVESIGLHGEPYAVGWCVFNASQVEVAARSIAIDPDTASGSSEDRKWVYANIPPLPITHTSGWEMLHDFWSSWMEWKRKGAVMFAECGWPVEAKFLAMCVHLDQPRSNFDGPYPLHEIASFMLSTGMDPMAEYPRLENELPKHDPLADARQSARLLFVALNTQKP